MASIVYDGKLLMKVDESNNDPQDEQDILMNDYGSYPFKVPTVYLDGCADVYFPQSNFSWYNDSVVLVRDKSVVAYTQSDFTELLAKDKDGNLIWVDGRSAPYEGCWDGEYLGETREAREFQIVEYDLKTSEKRKYKVLLDETSQTDKHDKCYLEQFVDTETLGSKFEIKDGVLTKYIGNDADLVIPDSVTEIDQSFSATEQFESIFIPKTLIDIPVYFPERYKAKHVKVDKDNPKYYSENGCLIDKQTATLIWAYSGNTIPKDGSVKKIGSYSFYGRKDLESIEIPDVITEIGADAFSNCRNLVKVSLPNSLINLGGRAFFGCEKLAEMKLPNSITRVASYLFYGCSSLTKIDIPSSITEIDSCAFSGCSCLTNVHIPDSVCYIGDEAFCECSSLLNITIPSTVTQVCSKTFMGCSNLVDIIIPDSVFEICNGAFSNCTSLTNIYIPSSVIEIGEQAFRNCNSLVSVHIPDSVCRIGEGIFRDCEALETVILPSSIPAIPKCAFRWCIKLSNIILPDSIVYIDSCAFCNCHSLSNITLPNSLVKIEDSAFCYTELTTLSIPDSVKIIGEHAFKNCTSLKEVTIPDALVLCDEKIFNGHLVKSGKTYSIVFNE